MSLALLAERRRVTLLFRRVSVIEAHDGEKYKQIVLWLVYEESSSPWWV